MILSSLANAQMLLNIRQHIDRLEHFLLAIQTRKEYKGIQTYKTILPTIP